LRVAVIDYGSGNLHSAQKALEKAANKRSDVHIEVTSDPEAVRKADRVVLPGVGAFGDCKRGLDHVSGLVQALEESVLSKGRPFLGICVGMQLLATRGLEHEDTPGLGWIRGLVTPLAPNEPSLRVPQMDGIPLLQGNRIRFLKASRSEMMDFTPISFTLSSSRPNEWMMLLRIQIMVAPSPRL